MVNNLKFSIIVLTHSGDDTLYQCLYSIKNQTFKKFKCIVIGYDTTDACQIIARTICKQDNRFSYIPITGKSLCYAKNLAVSLACNDYTMFIQDNDFLQQDCFEKAVFFIRKYNPQILWTASIQYTSDNYQSNINTHINGIYTAADMPFASTERCYIYDKIYRTSLLKNIRFIETEQEQVSNIMFNHDCLLQTNKVVNINYRLMHHYSVENECKINDESKTQLTQYIDKVNDDNVKKSIELIIQHEHRQLNYVEKEDILIVSFTSWKKRIQYCKHVVDLMMKQTTLPDKIILNLSEEEFPNKYNDLPKELIQEEEHNTLFEIYWVKENTNVWKKIIPTMNRFPQALVFSIDDDIEYPNNYISEMYNTYCENNKCYPIVAYEFIIDNDLCHSGPFTLTSKKFYGELLDKIYDELIHPSINERKWQSDIVYYKVTNSLGYKYIKCENIDGNTLYRKSQINKENKYSTWDKEYKNERKENIDLINKYLNGYKLKSLSIALCAIAKNENLYIREWVEWYKNIGISKIFLYDNNDINGEHFEEVINDYIINGFVEIINVRGIHKSLDKKYAEHSKYHGTQQDCFEECFINNKNNYDWMLFCDIDEFLTCDNLNLYLNKHLKINTDIILLNWIIYGDNEELIYSNKSLKNRFKYKSELRQYTQVKSFINCKTDKKMLQIDAHLALFENAIYRDSEFNIITPAYKKQIILGNCYIKHYLTKSCEEWILRKYHNTSATGKDYFNKAIDKRIKEFFTFNTDTIEKRKIIHRTMTLMDNISSKIIVSFTSFGQRLYNDAYITIKSILNQTIKPYKICLTLFNEDIKYIPNEIQKLIDENIVDLIISDKNLKPHLKYFYAMQKYRDCIIITIDDDHIYEYNMIENLINTHKKFPTCVVARRCHLIKRYENGDLLPYRKWHFEYSEQLTPGQNLFATGVGGVLYPPNIFELSDNNLNDIYKCLNADDIYLKWLEVNNHINVVWSPNKSYCGITIKSESAQKNRLQDINWKGTGNDDYLKIFKI